ncbi:hypothetical protein VHEMI01574 [[Torrubiella] hemipterigena]|uniref:Concanavalin A-like lectin/glucanase n=1 Tax=[Torrubiella] hemipterigena TaxID=1531966 RepID=A0A0A1T559_9HYPO|nr:hypothetical protein VHEMI01574 [[Torrubiella] hemipterigena]
MVALLPFLLSLGLTAALPNPASTPARTLSRRNEAWDTWCGAVQYRPPGKVKSVEASWVVPNVYPPPGGSSQTDWVEYHWVGIDGAGDCQTGILQAGTSGDIQNGYVNTQFWYEFWPDYPVFVNDFPVSPGHEVYVKVTASDSRTGTVYLQNKSTGKQRTIPMSMQSQGNLCFSTAEFIAEDPHTSTQWWPLARFDGTTMTGCKGTTFDGQGFGLDGANVGNMVQNGQTKCQAQIKGSDSVYLVG